ncbi:MAG: hypothetical protein P1U58_06255 [Verrucomicrobiales bacterium]|nr:hypothetical protein [Verrucomicrobiales bacterium]
MKTLSLFLAAFLATAFFTSCVSSENIELGGAPGWIAGGAKIEDEPDPIAPDPAILEFEEEGGPVELKIITDKRKYQQTSQRTRSVSSPRNSGGDLIEPGRDYRIKRLFR